jgi:hypothetical protein
MDGHRGAGSRRRPPHCVEHRIVLHQTGNAQKTMNQRRSAAIYENCQRPASQRCPLLSGRRSTDGEGASVAQSTAVEARTRVAPLPRANTGERLKAAQWFARLRRSREVTQVCSRKVTHQNGDLAQGKCAVWMARTARRPAREWDTKTLRAFGADKIATFTPCPRARPVLRTGHSI